MCILKNSYVVQNWPCLTVFTPWNSPWNSPGQNTGVGSYSHLQGIFWTQGSNPGLLHCGWIFYQLSYQGSPCVHITYIHTYIYIYVYIHIYIHTYIYICIHTYIYIYTHTHTHAYILMKLFYLSVWETTLNESVQSGISFSLPQWCWNMEWCL